MDKKCSQIESQYAVIQNYNNVKSMKWTKCIIKEKKNFQILPTSIT